MSSNAESDILNIYQSLLFLLACCCSVTKSCPAPWDPMDCSMPSFPVLHHLPEFAQVHIHWIGDAINHFILCCPLLFLYSVFCSIRVFSDESALCIRWPKYWSFSFTSILLMHVQGWFPLSLTGLISCYSRDSQDSSQHPSLKASVLWHSTFFMVQLSYLYMTTGKTIIV